MNLILWLNLMAPVVLQGLFPLRVDSPVLQPTNKTSGDDSDQEDEVEILASVIAFFSAYRQLPSNKTDGETAAVGLSYSIGRYLTHIHTYIFYLSTTEQCSLYNH